MSTVDEIVAAFHMKGDRIVILGPQGCGKSEAVTRFAQFRPRTLVLEGHTTRDAKHHAAEANMRPEQVISVITTDDPKVANILWLNHGYTVVEVKV